MEHKEHPMAKKAAKSSGKKAAPKSAKKSAAKKGSAKKSQTPKSPAKKSSGSAGSGMFKVSTGSGASPMELGQQLVALFNQGKADAWIAKVWAPTIESIEGVGMNMGWRGTKAVNAKNSEWMKTHIVHGARAEGPFVGSTGFAVKFAMDVEDTTNGQRISMEEVGVYTVVKGKIAREEFMYHCGG
jgi:hypothetical protein